MHTFRVEKTTMNNPRLKLTLVATALLAVSCSHFMSSTSTPLSTAAEGIPAAQGEVKTAKAKNDNTTLTVTVQHLAPPGRVANGATTYVVWAQPDGTETPQNIGALKVDDKLNGSLMSVLAYDSFKVFITAEPTAQVTEPTGGELLAANVLGKQ